MSRRLLEWSQPLSVPLKIWRKKVTPHPGGQQFHLPDCQGQVKNHCWASVFKSSWPIGQVRFFFNQRHNKTLFNLWQKSWASCLCCRAGKISNPSPNRASKKEQVCQPLYTRTGIPPPYIQLNGYCSECHLWGISQPGIEQTSYKPLLLIHVDLKISHFTCISPLRKKL